MSVGVGEGGAPRLRTALHPDKDGSEFSAGDRLVGTEGSILVTLKNASLDECGNLLVVPGIIRHVRKAVPLGVVAGLGVLRHEPVQDDRNLSPGDSRLRLELPGGTSVDIGDAHVAVHQSGAARGDCRGGIDRSRIDWSWIDIAGVCVAGVDGRNLFPLGIQGEAALDLGLEVIELGQFGVGVPAAEGITLLDWCLRHFHITISLDGLALDSAAAVRIELHGVAAAGSPCGLARTVRIEPAVVVAGVPGICSGTRLVRSGRIDGNHPGLRGKAVSSRRIADLVDSGGEIADARSGDLCPGSGTNSPILHTCGCSHDNAIAAPVGGDVIDLYHRSGAASGDDRSEERRVGKECRL